MNLHFDRQRLMTNITILIQQNGMNIGDVEAKAGASKGYISRLLKNDSIPSSDFIWRLAKILGVSTDMLIEGDYSERTDNVSTLRKFLIKLRLQTSADAIEWSPITTKYVNSVLKGEEALFFLVQEKGDNMSVPQMESDFSEVNSTYSFFKNRKIRSAAFPQEYAWMTGDGFKANLSDDRVIYLFPMCAVMDTGTSAGEIEINYFEMYLSTWKESGGLAAATAMLSGTVAGEWKTKQIFDTSRVDELEIETRDLYDTIKHTAYDLRITADVKDAILDFLEDQ